MAHADFEFLHHFSSDDVALREGGICDCMVSLFDVFWFFFQKNYVVFWKIECAIVKVHMPSPCSRKGITRRDRCPVLIQKKLIIMVENQVE